MSTETPDRDPNNPVWQDDPEREREPREFERDDPRRGETQSAPVEPTPEQDDESDESEESDR